MVTTILELGLELYRNRDLVSSAYSPEYLDYDLSRLFDLYNRESFNDKIPYVEVYRFSDKSSTPIKFCKLSEGFELGTGDFSCIKALQVAALNEFRSKKKFVFDSDTVSLRSINLKDGKLNLNVQKSRYSDQVQSHLVLDWESVVLREVGCLTLRGFLLAKHGSKLPSLNTELLSNSIGVSCIIYYRKDRNWFPYLPLRNEKSIFQSKKSLALFEGVYHCSASGVLEWSDSISMDYIHSEIKREIFEEIGLTNEDLISLEPLCLTRELLRAGKPQIFFGGFTSLNEKQLVEKRLLAIKSSKAKRNKVEVKHNHLEISNNISPLDRSLISLEAIGNLFYSKSYASEYIS